MKVTLRPDQVTNDMGLALAIDDSATRQSKQPSVSSWAPGRRSPAGATAVTATSSPPSHPTQYAKKASPAKRMRKIWSAMI